MAEQLFNVVFCGEIIAPDRSGAIANFARLFKLDVVKAEKVLSASRKTLKKGLPEEQAQRYAKALSAIGILVQIEPQTVEPEALLTLEPEADEGQATSASENESPDSDDGLGEEEVPSTYGKLDASKLSVQEMDDSPRASVVFAAIEDTSKVRRLNFKFTGSGSEFFKIWIVNVLLSIITLGIYSAWAKVRTNRYFYGNTWLDDAAFDYHADPKVILKGRIIAVVLFIVYSALSQTTDPTLSLIVLALVLTVLPWMIAKSLRFRMRMTSYRNIRFGFEGTTWGAAKAYSLMFIASALTLGLLVPYMLYVQTRYRVDETRYGVDHLSFNVSPREYYRIYFMAFVALLGVFLVGGIFSAVTPVLGGLAIFAGYALIITYVKVNTINLMFDNTHLGDHQFHSSLEIWPYFSLYFVNGLLMILTLGLFYPWAKVRIARYRTQCLMMLAHGSLNNYVAAQEEEVSAIGEEVGDIFDFEIGL